MRCKLRIAEAAVKFIQEGDTIFLDGGSTVLEMARRHRILPGIRDHQSDSDPDRCRSDFLHFRLPGNRGNHRSAASGQFKILDHRHRQCGHFPADHRDDGVQGNTEITEIGTMR